MLRPVLALLLLAVALMGAGCGHNRHHYSDTYIRVNEKRECLWGFVDHQTWRDGKPWRAVTDLTLTNIEHHAESFDFVVSGDGWVYSGHVDNLAPGFSVTFHAITTRFWSLNEIHVRIDEGHGREPRCNG